MEKKQNRTVAPKQQQQQQQARRTSNALLREPLPTPPPDPRDVNTNENIFKYPPSSTKSGLPEAYRFLLDWSKRDEEFFKKLNDAIENDCKDLQTQGNNDAAKTNLSETKDFTASQIHECPCCEEMREECEEYFKPLQMRFKSSASAALAAFGAIDQLNRLYTVWDQFLDMEKRFRQHKECLKYVNQLEQKVRPTTEIKKEKPHYSDTEAEIEQSVALLESMLGNGDTATMKRNQFKQPRERSKSVIVEDASTIQKEVEGGKNTNTRPYLLRRQSTYSDGKSKVSKWTKVKAAFKWERANVPAMNECAKDLHNGLHPINTEVARYLRVPSMPGGGGSSADSILSSSSGHLLSEAGTPGTISSASSMDDILEGAGSSRNALRRDSSKSDTRCDSRITDIMESSAAAAEQPADQQTMTVKTIAQSKSSSNKSLRRGKTVTDFEAVPEDVVAEIKSVTTRKNRLPPSPLNLNLKQDITDSDGLYSPYLSISPKDGTQSLPHTKKLHSPGNSSVPSSPSRHSDFFAEFESEELSSGDFSEPSSPNHLSSRKAFHQKQDEINHRYKMLRAKLDAEFETKRREWEKIKNNPNSSRALSLITPPKSDELSPTQQASVAANTNTSTKLLEENLTPDFKKKLSKWRKQISHSGSGSTIHQPTPSSPQPMAAAGGGAPVSPNKENICFDPKGKINWNLWGTGQMKFEGQGVCPLPDRKDLPEDFQKKLEEWNKIKRSGGGGSVSGASTGGGNDSIKRLSKSASKNKGSDDDRCYWGEKEKRDKHKAHEKDKSEKFAKLKAIVTEHPAKEIEVKTSAGVMKFEGISRKFTRKLYEWEKSRGIGPESSTFALLHPGYCPIDVGRIKESNNNDNSPTLGRSLSLESVSPNIGLPVMAHQASSLSLNDLNEFKDVPDGCCTADPLAAAEYKRYDEPEAVMVEVEDHIVETAKPLLTAHNYVEQQTPVYKYEEMQCNDYCNTRRVQSFESPTNLAPLLAMLKRSDELLAAIRATSAEIAVTKAMKLCEASLLLIRNVYPYFTENLVKPNVLNAISDVQIELSRLLELHAKSPLNEPCCTEIMEERFNEYEQELRGLYDSLEFLREAIQGGQNRYPKEYVPDINITTEDGLQTTCEESTSRDQLSKEPSLEATDEQSVSQMENDTESTTSTTLRSNQAATNVSSTNIALTPTTNSSNNTINTVPSSLSGKKKLRLRKIGSRQNSKTESDSSDLDAQNVQSETPRRLKRKNFRLKQRSFDDDYRRTEEYNLPQTPAAGSIGTISENVVYVLKMKPGQPIEQSKIEQSKSPSTERPSFLSLQPTALRGPVTAGGEITRTASNPNVFVKTKRKLFTAVQEPRAVDGVALIVKDIDTTTSSDEVKKLQTKPETTQKKLHPGSLEKKLQPKRAPMLSKALSMSNLQLHSFEEERKCQSVENVKPLQARKEVRKALASDSFRIINKNLGKIPSPSPSSSSPTDSSLKRREHIFRKNPEKLSKSVSATIKRIETKIAKTNSGSSVEQAVRSIAQKPPTAHDRTGNTLPRICRKLERKSLTPTTKHTKFDYTIVNMPQPTQSEPTTPLCESHQQQERPHTPLSERAQRLAKAKEQFLQGIRANEAAVAAAATTNASAGTRVVEEAPVRMRDEIVRNETWEQYRRSDQSVLSSVIGDDGQLLKSMSVDTITANTTTASEAGTDAENDIPRAVSRSGKFSSKLGFATLASKFRRGKKTKEPSYEGSSSALSALCKQSLMVDVIAAPQLLHTGSNSSLTPSVTSVVAATRSKENLMKSLSTPHAVSSPAAAVTQAARRQHVERLNKSQSDQIVKRQKESFV